MRTIAKKKAHSISRKEIENMTWNEYQAFAILPDGDEEDDDFGLCPDDMRAVAMSEDWDGVDWDND